MKEYKEVQGVAIYESSEEFVEYAQAVCNMIEDASKDKNTALAIRTKAYIEEKINSGKAIIALHGKRVIGFCYIETWEHGKFVANSGLIVSPEYRQTGLAYKIKEMAFQLSSKKFPGAKIFGLTTSAAVMKINSKLGYKAVTFSELTMDDNFWKGCETCKYFDILERTKRKHCLCTAMVYEPEQMKNETMEYKNIEIVNLTDEEKSDTGL
ncbi:MAG: GNAT family N-acetyltransferase [Bacteroidales bacterium]